MDIIIKTELRDLCFLYIDDCIIYSEGIVPHMRHIKLFLRRIKEVGMKLNHKKVQPLRKELEILGHIISDGKVLPDPRKVEAIQRLEPPNDKIIAIISRQH